jgi:hypothetical protein
MIKDEKLRQMASEHWGVDNLTEYHWEKTIEFARLVEKENARMQILENRRMYCHSKGGHSFVIKGDFGSIRGSSTETVIDKWRAVGHCENCDARLVVRYPEDKS